MAIVKASGITKFYRLGDRKIPALEGVSVSVNSGEAVAIMGPSGSGKSTLLQVLGTLDQFDDGKLEIAEQDVSSIGDRELSVFRRRSLGFVFQAYNLMPMLTAIENVAWPLLIDGRNRAESMERARELLAEVGMEDRAHHYPNQLSGGEAQRITIARALVNRPSLLLADEPTGALDSKTGKEILDLLLEQTKKRGNAMIMVTHDPAAAGRCDRTIRVQDGKVL